jgi:hypothetical protein
MVLCSFAEAGLAWTSESSLQTVRSQRPLR